MSEQPNETNSTILVDEVRSLHQKFDIMTDAIGSLRTNISGFTESQQVRGVTVCKSADSINIIIRFLADLRKLSSEELKNTVIEADAILSTANPIPADQNLDQTLEGHATKDKLKTILKEVFYLLYSSPLDAKADSNNPVASTSIETKYAYTEVKEEKIQFWRKYKNKYNYIERLKLKLPPINNSVEDVESLQNNVNRTVQNDANTFEPENVNGTVENDPNPIVQDINGTKQNSVNGTKQNDRNNIAQNDGTSYTVNDIIQNERVYELFKSRLQNSPYDDPYFRKNCKNANLTLTLQNGETISKPVSHVAPLIVLKKCDDLCPQENKKTSTAKHLQSSSKKNSNKINDSNSNNTTAQMTIRETRANKTTDITNSFNANVKSSTEKQHSTIKNSKYEPSKKKKKN